MKSLSIRFTFALSILLLGFTLNTPQAHAGLLLEPFVGYEAGGYTWGSTNQNLSGFGYGGRVGYESPFGFMLGADLQSGSLTTNQTPSNTVTPQDLGVFVGYDFPLLVRIWAAYGVSSQFKFSNGSWSDTFKGSDIKLGIGFKLLPMISLNLEYIMGTYTKDDSGSLGTNLTDKIFQIGVSLPFNLL